MKITVQDFTGIYAEQPFMQELRAAAETSNDIYWLDCTKIVGTDCYCDDEAIKKINEMINNTEKRSRIECSSIIENRGISQLCDVSANDIAAQPTIHFFDNGNYHYMSKLWTDRIQEPFTLIVFDHHPDMQPPRFGGILSCGGWVLEVLKSNKFIQNVIIIGVKNELIETIRKELTQSAEANILDKVTFIRESELEFLTPYLKGTWFDTYTNLSRPHTPNLYISIDKDALAPTYAATNWDQGSLSTSALKTIIAELAANHKILSVDICGERAHDFEGDELHSVQEADSLNNSVNHELIKFIETLCQASNREPQG